MEILSRSEASQRDLKFYFTGGCCKHGHISARRVTTRQCSTCESDNYNKYYQANTERIADRRQTNKEKANEYHKQHYQQNKERISKQHVDYNHTHKDQIAESARRYYEDNKEQYWWYYQNNKDHILKRSALYYTNNKNQRKQYREANKERITNWRKQYHETNKEHIKKYRKDNKEHILSLIRLWRLRNPHKVAEYTRIRNTRLENAIPNWYEEELVKKIYSKRDELNNKWKNVKFQVDHIIPLTPKDRSVCGLHCWANLQLLDASLNNQKGVGYETDW
jgi:hypothetical protein